MARLRNDFRGHILNPHRSFKTSGGINWGTRQCICTPNNPTKIDAGQTLLMTLGDLHPGDVIVPGSLRLSFNIELISTDPNRTLVQNVGRALVKQLTVSFGPGKLLELEEADVYLGYVDLWKTTREREIAQYQGIDLSKTSNVTNLRVGAENGDGSIGSHKRIADTYGNRFCIPLDFEMVEAHMPYYQSGFTDSLSFLLKFNDYDRVIRAKDDPKAKYIITDICREYEVVSHPTLAQEIRALYAEPYTFMYERVHFHQEIAIKPGSWLPDLSLNIPSASLKAVLILFESLPKPYERHGEYFPNPCILSANIVVEGKDQQLFSDEMKPLHQCEEAFRLFGAGRNKDEVSGRTCKAFNMAGVSLEGFLWDKFALVFDFRLTSDDSLHGTGRSILNKSQGVFLRIKGPKEQKQDFVANIFIIQDASVTVEHGRYKSAEY